MQTVPQKGAAQLHLQFSCRPAVQLRSCQALMPGASHRLCGEVATPALLRSRYCLLSRWSRCFHTMLQTSPCRHVLPSRSRRSGVKVLAVAASNGQDIVAPFNVVITGGSKGVGKALATEFLKQGDNVVICSRQEDKVKAAVNELSALAKAHGGRIKGRSCNISRPQDAAAFASFAKREMGTIDIWINNAASNAYKHKALFELSDADLVQIVETNVLGTMLGCKEAIQVMREQGSRGHIFNMDGAGADGNATPLFSAYGATKRGLAQLGKSLQAELKMLNIPNVTVHNLSPGMVTTELLMSGADSKAAKFFINCLAEQPETVAQELVPRIRQVPQQGSSSSYIRFLTKGKAYTQILGRLLAGQRKNRWVTEES